MCSIHTDLAIWRGAEPPPAVVQIGMLWLELPPAAAQQIGWQTEHARTLVANVPGYKFLIRRH
jgi:hypothetical protein